MRGFLAAALAFGVVAGSVWAEPGPTNDGSKPPAKLETAYAYLEACGDVQGLQQKNFDDVVLALLRTKPGMTEDKIKKMRPLLESVIKEASPEILAARAKIYAEQFSENDLGAMITFYRSDVGKRLVAARPALTIANHLIDRAIFDKISARLKAELLKKKNAEALKT